MVSNMLTTLISIHKPHNETRHVYHVVHLGDDTTLRVQLHKLSVVLHYHDFQAPHRVH